MSLAFYPRQSSHANDALAKRTTPSWSTLREGEWTSAIAKTGDGLLQTYSFQKKSRGDDDVRGHDVRPPCEGSREISEGS